MNAIAHCVEALYAVDANPIVSMIAEEGIRGLAASLPDVVDANVTGERRRAALGLAQYGAWLAGTALNGVSMAIHHKLCHTLGGTFSLAHAETHTAVLPYATAYNREAAPQAKQRIRRALGAPLSLREIGMPADGLDRAADLAVQNPYWNPARSSGRQSARCSTTPGTGARRAGRRREATNAMTATLMEIDT
jgi:alcohol dehydrogenase class IV